MRRDVYVAYAEIFICVFAAGTGKGGAWQGASVNTRINIYIDRKCDIQHC